jgi:hypothetical protein
MNLNELKYNSGGFQVAEFTMKSIYGDDMLAK